jgi:hypothetical protein
VLVFLASRLLLARDAPIAPPAPATSVARVRRLLKVPVPAPDPITATPARPHAAQEQAASAVSTATEEGPRIELAALQPIQNNAGTHGFVVQLKNRSDSLVKAEYTFTTKAFFPGEKIDYADQMDHLERQIFPNIKKSINKNISWPYEFDANSTTGIFNTAGTMNQDLMNKYINKDVYVIEEFLIVYTYKSNTRKDKIYYGELMAILDPISGGAQLIPGMNFNKHELISDKLALSPR